MNLALLAAVGIARSYCLATVLQSVGAKSTTSSRGLDPGLLVGLLRSVPYLVGLALDGAGFLLTVVALQSLPLFVVEAFTAGALAVTAVTAVAAAVWLKIPLSRGEWIGVGAGFGFGLVGIATRTLETPITVTGLLTDPSTYGIGSAGGLALLALATALQRGGVTQATAAMVVAETVIPSAIGLAFLGDRIRPGWEAVVGIGLIVAIGGAVALSRLGEIPAEPTTQAHSR
jgi:hypothetical protein